MLAVNINKISDMQIIVESLLILIKDHEDTRLINLNARRDFRLHQTYNGHPNQYLEGHTKCKVAEY